jgi:hypothetical protein
MKVVFPSPQTSGRAYAARARQAAIPRPEPLLVRHGLLESPPGQEPWSALARSADMSAGGVVWKPADRELEGGERLLTLRHFAMQSVQIKLERLLHEKAITLEPSAALFLNARTDHVYADDRTFLRLATGAEKRRGAPGQLPAFVDVARERLVVDVSRFFEPRGARLTSDGVQALVAIIESRRFAAYLEEHPQLMGFSQRTRQVVAAGLALRATARCVARFVLREPGLQWPPLARPLLKDAGPRVVMSALLSGAREETQATVKAFARLWQQWQQGRGEMLPVPGTEAAAAA